MPTHQNRQTGSPMPLDSSEERVRVVVVDDLSDLADNLTELLTLEGFDAVAARGGQEAIDLVTTFKPHCMLFDIAMPGIDGLELARRLRKAHGDDLVLIAMTGKHVNEARVADTFALVDHYFAKPLELDQLLRVLDPR
ncbi:MAG: response regulator [Burkholderiales bacterium]